MSKIINVKRFIKNMVKKGVSAPFAGSVRRGPTNLQFVYVGGSEQTTAILEPDVDSVCNINLDIHFIPCPHPLSKKRGFAQLVLVWALELSVPPGWYLSHAFLQVLQPS